MQSTDSIPANWLVFKFIRTLVLISNTTGFTGWNPSEISSKLSSLPYSPSVMRGWSPVLEESPLRLICSCCFVFSFAIKCSSNGICSVLCLLGSICKFSVWFLSMNYLVKNINNPRQRHQTLDVRIRQVYQIVYQVIKW